MIDADIEEKSQVMMWYQGRRRFDIACWAVWSEVGRNFLAHGS